MGKNGRSHNKEYMIKREFLRTLSAIKVIQEDFWADKFDRWLVFKKPEKATQPTYKGYDWELP